MRNGTLWVAGLVAAGLLGCEETIECPAGQAVCGGQCADVAVDPVNCGTCGNTCGTGEACKAGACTDCASACGEGQTCDDGVCRADVYVACFATDEVRGVTSSLAAAGPARTVDNGPISLAWASGTLWVSHSLAPATVVGFTPNVAGEQRFTLEGGDLQNVRAADGLLYVANAVASTLVVIDPTAQEPIVDEVSLAPEAGVAANPNGVALVGEHAVVTLYGDSAAPEFGRGQELAIVDVGGSRGCATPPCATVSRRISLDVPRTEAAPGAYDPPGFPFPSRALALGGKVYATLANLQEECSEWGCYYTKPAGHGRLAIVDPASDAPPVFVDLGEGCTNPGSLTAAGTTVWISCGASSAIVPVDVSGAAPVVGTAVSMPIVPGAVAACGGHLYVGDQYSGQVAKLAVTGGDVATQDVCTGAAYPWVADVVCPEEAP